MPSALALIAVLVVAFAISKFGTDAMTRDDSSANPASVASEVNQDETSTSVEDSNAMGLCDGSETSIPDAKPWKPGEAAIVANFTFGNKSPEVWSGADDFSATAPLRAGVSSSVALDQVSLVLCRGRGALQATISCSYMINGSPSPVEMRFWKRDLRLFEARTGRLVGQSELGHASTPCSEVIMFEDGDQADGRDRYPQQDERALLEQWTAP